MKVNAEQATAFFYPDVLVTCDQLNRQNAYCKEHPVFIADILSSSTEAFDRGDKFKACRQLHSLQEYWLIDGKKCQSVVFPTSRIPCAATIIPRNRPH